MMVAFCAGMSAFDLVSGLALRSTALLVLSILWFAAALLVGHKPDDKDES